MGMGRIAYSDAALQLLGEFAFILVESTIPCCAIACLSTLCERGTLLCLHTPTFA